MMDISPPRVSDHKSRKRLCKEIRWERRLGRLSYPLVFQGLRSLNPWLNSFHAFGVRGTALINILIRRVDEGHPGLGKSVRINLPEKPG
jgi:hypothetical protein